VHPSLLSPVSTARRQPGWRRCLTIPVCALGAFLTIAATTTTAARADAADDDFINNLAAQGITLPRDQLIMAAHNICSTESATAVGTHVPAHLTRLLPFSITTMMLGLPSDQAATFANAAFSAYCPQYLPQ
jgi:hypothetical protein